MSLNVDPEIHSKRSEPANKRVSIRRRSLKNSGDSEGRLESFDLAGKLSQPDRPPDKRLQCATSFCQKIQPESVDIFAQTSQVTSCVFHDFAFILVVLS